MKEFTYVGKLIGYKLQENVKVLSPTHTVCSASSLELDDTENIVDWLQEEDEDGNNDDFIMNDRLSEYEENGMQLDENYHNNYEVEEDIKTVDLMDSALDKLFKSFGLGDSLRDELIDSLVQSIYPDGHYIVRKGDKDGKFYILLQGTVKCVTNEDDSGVFLYEGDYFGEMSVVCKEPRTADVISCGEVTSLELSEELFQSFLDRDSQFNSIMLQICNEKKTRIIKRTSIDSQSFANNLIRLEIPKIKETEALKFYKNRQSRYINNFTIIKDLGSGSFGKVKLVFDKNTQKEYAMKMIDKKVLSRKGMSERKRNYFRPGIPRNFFSGSSGENKSLRGQLFLVIYL